MKVIKLPENGTNFVDYEISGKSIDFGDGEMSFRVDKKERDYEVTIDICQDYTGGLVMGASAGDKYVAYYPGKGIYRNRERKSEL